MHVEAHGLVFYIFEDVWKAKPVHWPQCDPSYNLSSSSCFVIRQPATTSPSLSLSRPAPPATLRTCWTAALAAWAPPPTRRARWRACRRPRLATRPSPPCRTCPRSDSRGRRGMWRGGGNSRHFKRGWGWACVRVCVCAQTFCGN